MNIAQNRAYSVARMALRRALDCRSKRDGAQDGEENGPQHQKMRFFENIKCARSAEAEAVMRERGKQGPPGGVQHAPRGARKRFRLVRPVSRSILRKRRHSASALYRVSVRVARMSQPAGVDPRTRGNMVRKLIEEECAYVRGANPALILGPLLNDRNVWADLQVLVAVYQRPILDSKILSNEEFASLFCTTDWNLLVLISGQLLPAPSDTNQPQSEAIGRHFCSLFPFFKIYVTYCAKFENSRKVYHELYEGNAQFRAFLEACFDVSLSQPSLTLSRAACSSGRAVSWPNAAILVGAAWATVASVRRLTQRIERGHATGAP